jgi:N-glycosylase/DNA lyase
VRPLHSKTFSVSDYNLSLTLSCGQAFRWHPFEQHWFGVVEDHWIRAEASTSKLTIRTTHSSPDWDLISDYFQTTQEIAEITDRFPNDPHLNQAVKSFKGMRLLRQHPWECLASFILSSTKQIPHIQKITESIATHYGKPLAVPKDHPPVSTFPSPEVLSQVSESDLRKLGMGYRAPYLKMSAQMIASGDLSLSEIVKQPYEEAKTSLQRLHGVGPKIADCVLLFAFGKQDAFPIDVWVRRALKELYFPGKKISQSKLETFAKTYFQPYPGYAQQYLFHYMRTAYNSQSSTQDNFKT